MPGPARTSASIALALALGASRPAQASPEDLFGFGPHASAMGGTGAAAAQGFEAVHGNPALLSLEHERSLTLGFQAARFDLHADGPNAPGAMSVDPMQGVLIGAVLPIPFGGALERRVTLGFGFFTPTGVVVRGKILYPEKPSYALLADRAQSVAVQAGLGADLGYGVRVGAGFAALAAIAGDVVVATNASGQIGTTVDDQLVAAYGPIVGATYDLGAGYRVGATYRGVLQGRFAVTIRVYDLGSITVPPFNIAGVAQYDPWQVQGEVVKDAGPWRFVAGATFKRWSAYPGAPEPTVLCPDEQPDCKALRPSAPGFHDTIVPRVGLDRRFDDTGNGTMHLRFGAFYEPSPAPAQTREGNLLDDDRVALTLGGGLELPRAPLFFDVFAQAHYLVPRTTVKDADVSPDNAGAPSVKTHGTVLMAGMTAGVRF